MAWSNPSNFFRPHFRCVSNYGPEYGFFWLHACERKRALSHLRGIQSPNQSLLAWQSVRASRARFFDFFRPPLFGVRKRADMGMAIRAPKSNIGLRKAIFPRAHFEQSEPLPGQKPTSSNPSHPSNPSQPCICKLTNIPGPRPIWQHCHTCCVYMYIYIYTHIYTQD